MFNLSNYATIVTDERSDIRLVIAQILAASGAKFTSQDGGRGRWLQQSRSIAMDPERDFIAHEDLPCHQNHVSKSASRI